jgi:hypothetical protein
VVFEGEECSELKESPIEESVKLLIAISLLITEEFGSF